jgi:hypothetical protein
VPATFGPMARFVTAGAGFLLAVLWFDLMHDVQVAGHRDRPLPEPVLDSIARYYRRVTTDARPMNRLVALSMVATLTAIVVQITRHDAPTWAGWTSLALAAVPISIGAGHTFRSAVRLGARDDSREAQSDLARSIFRDHVVCLGSIEALLTVQLAFAT